MSWVEHVRQRPAFFIFGALVAAVTYLAIRSKRRLPLQNTVLQKKSSLMPGDEEEEETDNGLRKITLGVCAMDNKVRSKPMRAILRRLKTFGDFKIVIFEEEMIQNAPPHEWPVVECLISFFSTGFPLAKAEAYVALRKPMCINDLTKQRMLFDRRVVYETLQANGIRVARYVVVDRDEPGAPPKQDVIEDDDWLEVDGVRIEKPFVEKPLYAEDHNVYIYYPRSAGGGSKRLFRKVGDRSSNFYPDVHTVRKDGSFLYEEFLATDGTDIKVYTVHDVYQERAFEAEYAHAEARKSPVLDGKVQRTADGKEVRYPVTLSQEEKDLARKVCCAFGQSVCGFDLLRAKGRAYVCDVNGWSFVKGSPKYYDDCSMLIRTMILRNLDPTRLEHSPMSGSVMSDSILTELGPQYHPKDGGALPDEELRSVVAVIRHGDRTPKQKMKMKTQDERFLRFFRKANKSKSEIKLKSAVELQELLDVTREILRHHEVDDEVSEGEGDGIARLMQLRSVLEKGGHFEGINRKVQLKPVAWKKIQCPDGTEKDAVTETLLVLKWGGELTHAGHLQAETLGKQFRSTMYPGDSAGLLRLHSTYRHDLKIYSSDEGRCQKTAAAFAKGFLDLEGELTPIIVSLVRKDEATTALLDDSSGAAEEMESIKKRLHRIMNTDREFNKEFIRSAAPTEWSAMVDALKRIKNPYRMLERVHGLIKLLTSQLKERLAREKLQHGGPQEDGEPVEAPNPLHEYRQRLEEQHSADTVCCGDETLFLMHERWKKLAKDFYHKKTHRFDISKIPDVYDCIKYDFLHNRDVCDKVAYPLMECAQALADFICPQEYGIDKQQKLDIGTSICRRLLRKIYTDLVWWRGHREGLAEFNDESHLRLDHDKATAMGVKNPWRHVRTRLYFTSASHLHSLLNVVRLGKTETNHSVVTTDSHKKINAIADLDYLTHIVIRLYEKLSADEEDSRRFRVEIRFSAGTNGDPLQDSSLDNHTLSVSPMLTLNNHLTLEEVESYFRNVLGPDDEQTVYLNSLKEKKLGLDIAKMKTGKDTMAFDGPLRGSPSPPPGSDRSSTPTALNEVIRPPTPVDASPRANGV
eukprot:GILK01002844.1.p1 GENE.GILK01002844.1~~GILK01002844.1.p1  ORF type:complete len:1088 (+),score=205.37 GILK01002844.1:63-3326(+)